MSRGSPLRSARGAVTRDSPALTRLGLRRDALGATGAGSSKGTCTRPTGAPPPPAGDTPAPRRRRAPRLTRLSHVPWAARRHLSVATTWLHRYRGAALGRRKRRMRGPGGRGTRALRGLGCGTRSCFITLSLLYADSFVIFSKRRRSNAAALEAAPVSIARRMAHFARAVRYRSKRSCVCARVACSVPTPSRGRVRSGT